LGGDGFSFIEKIEGIDFKAALVLLAEKAGVPVEFTKSSGEDRSKKERLYELMSAAALWYEKRFTGSSAEAYAKERGLTEETIAAWGLGYAPEAWRELLEAFTHEGYTISELLAAGLIKEADGKAGTYYDRFRNRLIFPIRDSSGRVVAFTGRALSPKDEAKYLNSPETLLYHKSDLLFGMDRAKEAIRTRRFAILVEGQFDLIHAHQAGFTNTVALSGTALTETHVRLLKRFSENLMLLLDADSAGLTATARSASLALKEGLRVKAVSLPEGQDPADCLSAPGGAAAFTKRLTAAEPIIDFFLAELSKRERDPHRLVRTVEQVVLPLLVALPSPLERDHAVQSVARTLGLSSEAVRESVARIHAPERRPVGVATVPPLRDTRNMRKRREDELLALLHLYPGSELAKHVEAEYCRITEAPVPAVALPEATLFEMERLLGESPDEQAADELLRAFEHAVVREAYEQAVGALRRAEREGDAGAIEVAERRCHALQSRLALLRH
jgi:DNA primase